MTVPTQRTLLILPGGGANMGEEYYKDAGLYTAIWKDPESITDVAIDWSRYMEGGADGVASFAWATSDNVTINSVSRVADVCNAVLSGDPGVKSTLVNTIVTDRGLKHEHTIQVYGIEK